MSVFIIAEAGINHNGDIDIAKKLIDQAAMYKCNAIKFQKRSPNICIPESQKNIIKETPWGDITYLEYKYHIEFGLDEYKEIDKYCKQINMSWFASVWDLESLEFLQQFNLKYNKVPSAMILHKDLLNEIALKGKHTFISTGMSTMSDISKAVEIFRRVKCSFELMHCVSTYPMRTEDANLNCIKTLRDYFNCNVGYSGHESGLAISYAAIALGVTSIERHITLDRSMYGTDQAASLSPEGLRQLVGAVRKIEMAMGNGEKKIIDDEKIVAKKLRSYL